jgi:hypothetical protein
MAPLDPSKNALSARDIDEILGVERDYAPLTPEAQAVYDAQVTLQNAFAATMQVPDQMGHPAVVAAQQELDVALQAEARIRGTRDTAA